MMTWREKKSNNIQEATLDFGRTSPRNSGSKPSMKAKDLINYLKDMMAGQNRAG